ncbi:hypothetical protein DICVIV_10993 [Dictyocaulus viviparus]|uniref:Fork-head domain-containing protein n=1 Tax=Dictyocaulus viviparus TaxID=29172 RepID=A0A0D8XGY0_DICVI|nr:hypothetical protein DICVIV_10993 [Dictyocaulus viviparus]
MKLSSHFKNNAMDDPIVSSPHEGSLSVLLSACAPPFSIEDDFSLGYGFLNNKNDDRNESLDGFDSLANSPISHLTADSHSPSPSSFCSQLSINLDCEPTDISFLTSQYDHSSSAQLETHDQILPTVLVDGRTYLEAATSVQRPTIVRKRTHECSMVCWLFRTLLTSEYQALPLNSIFEIFENTNPSSAHGRHWRQSIRYCLMSSAVFVRVLTPNPRKDYLMMNESGSWWTVHPDCEEACAEEVFRSGATHRCPPNGSAELYRLRMHNYDDTTEIIYKNNSRKKYISENIPTGHPYPGSRKKYTTTSYKHCSMPMRFLKPPQHSLSYKYAINPQRGDHLVVDHEEEVS